MKATRIGVLVIGLFIGLVGILFSQAVSSLSFTLQERGGISLTTQGGTDLTVGYTRIQPNSGSTTPSSLAIFGFRENGVLVTEAGVSASQLLATGRMYAEMDGAVNTGLAIANPNSTAATISFFFIDTAGQSIGSGSFTLGANQQIAKFLTQAPFNGIAAFRGTFNYSSTVPVATVALRGFANERGEFLITTLPVAQPGFLGSQSIFPHFAAGGGWKTYLILVNPEARDISGKVDFYSQGITALTPVPAVSVNVDGLSQTGFNYTIPGGSSRRFEITSTAGLVAGSIRLISTAGSVPLGSVVFSFKSGDATISEAGVPADFSPSTAVRMFVETSGDFRNAVAGSIASGIAIANGSATDAATVNFDLTTMDGRSTGMTGSLTISPRGQTALFLNQLQGFQNLPASFQGLLRVSTTSQSGIAVLGLRGRYNERRDFLITTTAPTNELGPPSRTEILFPHIVNGGGYTTQFILYNGIAGQTSSGMLSYISQSGQPLSLSFGGGS